jgi:hypothetical protein
MSDNEYGPLLRKVRRELEPKKDELERVRARIDATLADHRQDKALLGNLPTADRESIRRVRKRIEQDASGGGFRWLWLAPVAAAVIAFFVLNQPKAPSTAPVKEIAEHPVPAPLVEPAKTRGRSLSVEKVRGSGAFENEDARALVAQLEPAMKKCGPPKKASVTIVVGGGGVLGVVVSSPEGAVERFESCLEKELAKVRLDQGELTAAPGQLGASGFVRFEIESVDD